MTEERLMVFGYGVEGKWASIGVGSSLFMMESFRTTPSHTRVQLFRERREPCSWSGRDPWQATLPGPVAQVRPPPASRFPSNL